MNLSHSCKTQPKRRGVTVVFVALSLIVILGVAAISFDGGGMLSERRHAQSVADAAAMAAASDLFKYYWTNQGTDPNDSAKDSALKVARENGYNDDGITNKVFVNMPPSSGDYMHKNGYVEVIVEYYFKRSFSNIFSSGPIPIRA